MRTVYLFPLTSARRSSAGCDGAGRDARTSRCSHECAPRIVGSRASGISAIVWHACERAGLPPVGAHRLRHTAATEMLRAGGSLAEVGQVLRHARPDTTSIYAKVDRRSLIAVVRPWPGGAA